MTVQAQLAREGHSMEYLLCIEGIGWVGSDETDLTGAWQGTVFTTSDINGTLATVLGCDAISSGLTLPRSISERIDPTTFELQPGGMTFTITDGDDILDTAIRPTQDATGSIGKLTTALGYYDTTVVLQYTNPGGSVSAAAGGDTVWLAGREAVTLGTRSGSNPYTYTSSARATLGTPRGILSALSLDTDGAKSYPVDTSVYPLNPAWWDRRVLLLMHVPGETRGNCARLYMGRLRGIRRIGYGTQWEIATVADSFQGAYRVRRVDDGALEVEDDTAGALAAIAFDGQAPGAAILAEAFVGTTRYDGDTVIASLAAPGITIRNKIGGRTGQAGVRLAYTYRSVAGGRAGAVALTGVTAPQAETLVYASAADGASQPAGTFYFADTTVLIGKEIRRALFTSTIRHGGNPLKMAITGFGGSISTGDSVRFLLTNYSVDPAFNRFKVNNTVRRNAIDTMLILLTSFNDEFAILTADTGGTTTNVEVTDDLTGQDWTGYALHCVSGDNKGEARIIASNDADTVVVETAFSNAPTAADEYQIRNTVYDVLPSGWGMEVPWQLIDIETFEQIRDADLGEAELGLFALGSTAETNLWQIIKDFICQPYGLSLFYDLTTGKLSLRYIGQALVDGLTADYVSVTESDMLRGSLQYVDLVSRQQLSSIVVHTRAKASGTNYIADHDVENAETDSYTIRLPDTDLSFSENNNNTLEINALLNTRDEIQHLTRLALSRLLTQSPQAPETEIKLTLEYLLTVQAGQLISVTSANTGARDPYDGTAGLTSVICRVLQREIVLQPKDPHIKCKVQIVNAISAGIVAPAATVTSKATTPNRFVVTAQAWGRTNNDTNGFGADDLVHLYDKTGVSKEGPFTVVSTTATTVVVAEAISSTIATGDYVAFAPWVTGSNTNNMEKHAALADSTNEELGTSDAPKEWA